MEAISHAGTVLGVLAKDGVVLAAEKKVTGKLLDLSGSKEGGYGGSGEKIFLLNSCVTFPPFSSIRFGLNANQSGCIRIEMSLVELQVSQPTPTHSSTTHGRRLSGIYWSTTKTFPSNSLRKGSAT